MKREKRRETMDIFSHHKAWVLKSRERERERERERRRKEGEREERERKTDIERQR